MWNRISTTFEPPQKNLCTWNTERMSGGDSSGDDCALQIDVGRAVDEPQKKKPRGNPKGEGGGGQGVGWKSGDMVWAKVSGFSHWPGKVHCLRYMVVIC